MAYAHLVRSGLTVGRIGLGTTAFGDTCDGIASNDTVHIQNRRDIYVTHSTLVSLSSPLIWVISSFHRNTCSTVC